MNKKAYLVLSVKDIRNLLKRAVASQKAAKEGENHCVVIRDVEIDCGFENSDGEVQISSYDVAHNPL